MPRDSRWRDATDSAACIAPLPPTHAPDDAPALLAEADAWAADPARTLRTGLAPDLARALRRALAERDDARAERDGLARRLQAVGAIARGARFRLDPEPGDAPP